MIARLLGGQGLCSFLIKKGKETPESESLIMHYALKSKLNMDRAVFDLKNICRGKREE